eukprot:GFUD01000150.1.p1 GENE.GFUD01000150.1~~GFUD01000150.1.p1  ORF type:complete len:175 (+),score=64.29 GFUD01000150.1:57-581(+)
MPSACVLPSPTFLDHVKTSSLQKFSPLYFTVGLVEEVAELTEELDRFSKGQENDNDLVVSEVGDVCWYLYALCNSLDDISPVLSSSCPPDIPQTDISVTLLSACGKLCGSIKKWSRGDQSWDLFKPRIQRGVSDLLKLVEMISPVPLEVAMEKNIEKIKGRRARGVVKGDGNLR